jgi:putative transposase
VVLTTGNGYHPIPESRRDDTFTITAPGSVTMGSTLTNLIYHIIFSTKGRELLILPEIKGDLYHYIIGIIGKEGGFVLQIGGMPDHIHMVIKLKPIHSLSDIVKKIKANSSKWLNQSDRLPFKFSWQEGYGAFTASESKIQTIIQYVKKQETHHRRMSFKDEFIRILKLHEIEFDENQLWK